MTGTAQSAPSEGSTSPSGDTAAGPPETAPSEPAAIVGEGAAEPPVAAEPAAIVGEGAAEPPVAAEPAAETAEAERPAAPVYQPYQMPDGFEADEPRISAYNNILGKYGIGQEAGQELLNFHAEAVRDAASRVEQHQRDAWTKLNEDSVAAVQKTFGNRRDTVIADANEIVRRFGADPKAPKKVQQAQIKELWSDLGFTGAGNRVSLIRLLANVKTALSEGAAPPRSLGDTGKSGAPWDARYGTKQTA